MRSKQLGRVKRATEPRVPLTRRNAWVEESLYVKRRVYFTKQTDESVGFSSLK